MPIQYYMRAYNNATFEYVNWVVNDQSDSTGIYSGYSPSNLANIVVNKIVQSKVENFLKPHNTTDGYFIHLNSYDWLHSTPPGPPIPAPTQLVGLSVVRGFVDEDSPRDHASLFWDETEQQWEFAFNTNGDGVTIGDSLPIVVSDISVDDTIRIANNKFIISDNVNDSGDINLIKADTLNRIQLGTSGDNVYIPGGIIADGYLVAGTINPSQSGFIRNSNSTSVITFRNLANSQDINLLSTSSNAVNIGDVAASGINFNINSSSSYNFLFAGSPNVVVGSTLISFDSSVVAPLINQLTRVSGNGQNITFKAQDTSAGGGIGGNLILSSGAGSGSDGYVNIIAGNQNKLRVFPSNSTTSTDNSTILSFNNVVRFDSSLSSPIIRQDQINTASATGQTLLILSQSNIGGTSVGGNLHLSSGNATTAGNVNIQTGQTTKLSISPTIVTSFNSIISFDSAVTSPIFRQNTTSGGLGQDLIIQSQNSSTGTGGNLNLTSGAGNISSNNGKINFQNGGTTGGSFSQDLNGPFFSIGSNPANNGSFRVSNSVPALSARNQANTQDIIFLSTDTSNRILYGSAAINAGHIFNTSASSVYDFQINSVSQAQILTSKFAFKQGIRRNVTNVDGAILIPDGYDYIAITTLSSPYSITLPASPTIGDSFELKDTTGNAAINNITVVGNGHNINGSPTYLLSLPYASATFTFVANQWGVT